MPLHLFDPLIFRRGYGFIPGQSTPVQGPVPGAPQTAYPSSVTADPSPSWGFISGTPIAVTYVEAGASATPTSEAHVLPPIQIFLGDGAVGPAVPGSIRFVFRGRTYVDRNGALVHSVSPTTNAGTPAGSIDYATLIATVTDYAAGSNTVTLVSMLSRYAEPGVTGAFFRTPGAPLKEGSLTLRATTLTGELLNGTADINGVITGAKMTGRVDWPSGLARVDFGTKVTAAGNEAEPWYDADLIDGEGKLWKPEPVDASTIFFGTVVFRSIPMDPDILGLDPVRLPSDGRVLGYQPGGVLVIHHTQVTEVPSPVAGAATNLGRTQIALLEVLDSEGTPIEDVWYTANLMAGTVTWANPLNLAAYTLPVVIRDRIEQAVQCADVQITGEIGLQTSLVRDFPEGTLISSAIAFGDLQARVANLFDQQTYQPGVWSDVLDGSPAGATYNDVVYPIAVTNHAAIDERWAIVFDGPTAVRVIGETTGQVFSGSITNPIAPANPVAAAPYFEIDPDGWGGGWQAGNVLRFNTVSATKPIWAARTTLQGPATEPTDSVRIQAYGNAH